MNNRLGLRVKLRLLQARLWLAVLAAEVTFRMVAWAEKGENRLKRAVLEVALRLAAWAEKGEHRLQRAVLEVKREQLGGVE